MTLAEATRQYQIALENLRMIENMPIVSIDEEYEDAEMALRDAKKAMEVIYFDSTPSPS